EEIDTLCAISCFDAPGLCHGSGNSARALRRVEQERETPDRPGRDQLEEGKEQRDDDEPFCSQSPIEPSQHVENVGARQHGRRPVESKPASGFGPELAWRGSLLEARL